MAVNPLEVAHSQFRVLQKYIHIFLKYYILKFRFIINVKIFLNL